MEPLVNNPPPGTPAADGRPSSAASAKAGFESLRSFLGKKNDPPDESSREEKGREPCSASPTVETVREEGTIVRLIVTCRCGERIEIDCDY